MGVGLRFFAALLSVSTFVAVPISRADEEVARELAEKVQKTRESIVEAESQKRKVLASLYVIRQRMKRITQEKGHLTSELFEVQDNAKSLAKIIASLEGQIEKQRKQLRRRLRAIYKLSGESYVALLFSQSNPQDLDETLRFLKIVADADHRLIRGYRENVALYKRQKDRLRVQVERLVTIEKNIKKQESLLAADHTEKSRIVRALDRARSANLVRIKKLRTKTQEIDSGASDITDGAIAELLKPSIFERKGQLSLPIQARVAQDFGLVTDERYKTRLSHKGWSFAAPAGTPVSSIFDGKVVFADQLEGYGHTIVVDHGDHYYAVYAHLARAKAKSGDTLNEGQVFAESAPASRWHNEGIYFELRHFSEAENPANWIDRVAKATQRGERSHE